MRLASQIWIACTLAFVLGGGSAAYADSVTRAGVANAQSDLANAQAAAAEAGAPVDPTAALEAEDARTRGAQNTIQNNISNLKDQQRAAQNAGNTAEANRLQGLIDAQNANLTIEQNNHLANVSSITSRHGRQVQAAAAVAAAQGALTRAQNADAAADRAA
ncbi:MAG: hypothetical protein ACRECO_14765, partial [Xanthobacteraceae bacterium]